MKNINWGANLLYPSNSLYPSDIVFPLEFNLLNARYYSKYLVDGKEYNQTLNEFKYSNIINPNNSISIGNTCSSSVTFSIYNPEITLENKDITIFEGVKGNNGIEYVQIGIFTVTKEESNGEYTKYTAYDKMYKAEKGYFSELTYPSTDKAILEEICTKLGIQLATSITNTHTITDKPQGYTMREMIGYMAMLQGCNAAINSDGNLEIKWYKDSGYILDGHQYYQQGVTFTTSKDFTIRKLTCNNTKSGDSKTSEITAGDGATGLSFANPFMTQAILNEVYNKIGGFQFRPLTVKFLGDWRLEVGDIITVNKGGVNYKVPIMQITHECDGGLMDTATSIGQSDTENSNIASGPITKQMERYYADLVLINKAVIENADITNANIENLKAHQAYIDQLKANKIETVTADIVNANVEKLKAVNAEITKLKANSLTADIADLKYAQIDFANVKGQVVTTSLIKDGAVTNEKVQSLSANKLTAGTIDASKITVTNLNADNITVGTINGKRIGTGSLSLDKLAEEVPTKEYLDRVQEDLQGQIDGNIETFTKTEIPTLNNEPAVNWIDDTTRKKHIGDICYVVNPTSSADGYSYRFANTGTEQAPVYEWVLIKDSDVTKALQDIININGEITGIKKFDVEISSWKTDTDSELSSLKTRTTSLETDMGNKVDTTTFNEVKQTVDENSSTITNMSETLSKKADSSTVTTLSNTVNSIKQTTDSNTSSISSLTTTVTKVESTANNANKTASEAKTAASNAETAATNSANSATRAEAAASSSATNASNAAGKASEAATSASNAEMSASNSASSASSAAASAENAKKSADSAATSASNAAKDITTIKSNYNTLSQTVSSNTATIEEVSNTVTTKADKSTLTEVSNKVNSVTQDLSSYKVDIASQFSNVDDQLNGDYKVYNVTEMPTKDNYPAIDWFIPIYPATDLYPSDNLVWTYSEEQYAKNKGAVAYNSENGKMWRWSLGNDKKWYWREVSNSESAYTLTQNALLKVSLNEISTSLSSVKKDYVKITELASRVAQEINNDNASIISALSGKYATLTTLDSYSTTNEIIQAINKDSTSISAAVTARLNNYATSASLNAYIKKDPATGELKSAIEAIADTINITARGGLNLSGDRFTLNSTNTSITADGTITCNNFVGNGGTIGGWSINSTSIYSDYRYDPNVGHGLYRVSLDKSTGSDSKVMSVRATVKDNVFNYPFYVRSDGYFYSNKGNVGGWDIGVYLSKTTQAYIAPGIKQFNVLKNAVNNNTTSSLSTSLYDFSGDGKVDITDFVYVKNYLLGNKEFNKTNSAIAKESNVTTELNANNPAKAFRVYGTDMWGDTRETYLGINGLKTEYAIVDTINANAIQLSDGNLRQTLPVIQTGEISQVGTGGWVDKVITFSHAYTETPMISILPTVGTTYENVKINSVSNTTLNISMYCEDRNWTYKIKWFAIGY